MVIWRVGLIVLWMVICFSAGYSRAATSDIKTGSTGVMYLPLHDPTHPDYDAETRTARANAYGRYSLTDTVTNVFVPAANLLYAPLAHTQVSSTITDLTATIAAHSAVAANTAKTGITSQQAADIVTNNAKGQTTDVQAAIDGSAAPTASNVFATMDDVTEAGGGDMTVATYDPTSVAGDAFDMDSMVEGTTTKILTGTERTKLTGIETSATADQSNAEIKTAYEANADTNVVTDAEKTVLGNTSGTNTGDANGTPEGTAVLSTGESGGTKYLREDGDGTSSWQTPAGGGDALVANPLSQFAATTSAQFAGVISDETGTGVIVLATDAVLVTPDLGIPSAVDVTNATGTHANVDIVLGVTTTATAGSLARTTGDALIMQDNDASDADVTFSNDTVRIAKTETLTNKTLTAPIVTGAGSIKITGEVQAIVNVLSKAAAYTLGTDEATEVGGSLVIATAAMVLTLPTATAGYSGCFMAGQGVTAIIQLTPITGDYLVVTGVRKTIATAYKSAGGAGDKICYIAANADDWYITSEVGTWAE